MTGRELDADIRQELSTLASAAAGTVARHLVMAGKLIDSDPDLAHAHAQEARRMAGRVAVVREAAGQAAYASGHYAQALGELRAAKRLNGAVAFLPMMADAERGLGNPRRALDLVESPDARELDSAGKAELLIVKAGAQGDLGDLDAALATLQVKALDSRRQVGWVARLRYAYADLLLAADRERDAVEWFTKAAEADVEGETDADDRLAELAGLTVVVLDDEDDDGLEPHDLDGGTDDVDELAGRADGGPHDDAAEELDVAPVDVDALAHPATADEPATDVEPATEPEPGSDAAR